MYRGLKKEVYVLFLCMLINGVGNFVYPLLTIILTDKILLSSKEIGFLIMCFTIIQGIFMSLSGILIDKFSKKKMLQIMYSIGIGSYFICSLFDNHIMVFFLFLAAGSFLSATPIINTMIADYTNSDTRKEAFSLIYLANNIGYAIAPLLSGMLYKNHLTLLFYLNCLFSFTSIVVFTIFIKETSLKTKSIEKSNRNNFLHKTKSIKDLKTNCIPSFSKFFIIFKNSPIILIGAIVVFCFQFAYSQWGFLLPIQMISYYSIQGTRYYGVLGAINGIIVILLTSYLQKMFLRVKTSMNLVIGGMLYAVAFLMFGLATDFIIFIIGIIIMTLGEIFISINYQVLIANSSKSEYRGRINSILSAITGSGLALGPVVIGYLENFNFLIKWVIVSCISIFAASTMFISSRKLETGHS